MKELSELRKYWRDGTLNQIYQIGKKNNICLEDSIIKMIENNEFKPKIKNILKNLIQMIHKWRENSKKKKHFDLLKLILDESLQPC